MKEKPTFSPSHLLILLTVLLTLLLTTLNLWFGELNQDEGWYLYSARQILQGRYPFIDFASTQGPVMSFAYAALWGPLQGMGLVGGRLVTALMGWATAGLAAALAWRLRSGDRSSRSAAAFATFVLIGVNIYQSYFTTVVKTYALGGLLVAGGFLALTAGGSSRRRQRCWAAVAGVLLALAAGSRISLGALLPVVFLWLAVVRYRDGREACPWSFALGAALALGAIFGPFLMAAPEPLFFGMVQYHAGREAGSLASLLAYKSAFILRTVRAYLVPVALLVVAVLKHSAGHRSGENPARSPLLVPLVLGIGVVTIVHFLAPFPYDDYQAVIYPLFAVLVGVSITDLLGKVSGRFLLVLLCALAAFSSPRLQDLFAAPRDRIWWPMRTESPVAQLRRVAGELREQAGPEGVLLTQDTYIAVEAGLSVPAGMEMGPFCYFPEMATEKAEACHVLNRELLAELLATSEATVAAFSAYGLSIAGPAVQPIPEDEVARLQSLLRSRYTPTAVIPAFGQAQTDLCLYRRK
ncbi:MAG: hypothetical protein QGH42_03360 [Kiritimatiellia bacterium]|jgi:4-amino-4-deoxy-L-arabinose transferase-like glycosyltransferase|nr:hypothetical protein [Kiritimatiellia bacterium]MDP6810739.1 hypothetical protein [Kiritimatiellia bacterium]MDP7023274.1 hypothetical protein [Kiritimatiellia bacterium]